MATYEEIYGKRVKDFDSDPTLESSYEGQVWYDKSTGVLKSVVPLKAWASTSILNNPLARSQGAGTTSAGLSMGGQDYPGTKLTVTEEYNGTGWSLGGSMPAAKSDHAGAGTQTAAYAAGGSPYLNSAYNYNGTSWSGIPNIGTARQKFAGCGTTTASLVFGAQVPGSPPQGGQTEEYNGSSWSEQNDLGTARAKLAGCGTQTAGLGFGGYQPTIPSQPKQKAQTEQYDGTSWSEVSDMVTATNAGGGAGTQTAAIAFGGYNGTANIATTQDWNGTAWTTSSASLGAGVSNNAGAGTSTSALSMGGYAPSTAATINVEEYNVSINTITAGAWASGGALGLARNGLFGVGGPSAAGLVFGGGYPDKGNTEEYDGTSWTEQNDLNTARRGLGGFGIQTAAVAVGGITSSNSSAVEHYDGSSWTNATSLPTASNEIRCGAGTQTAGLSAGGRSGPTTFLNATHEYDGSSWSSGGNLSAGRGGIAGGCNATQTAAIAFGGYTNTPQNPVSPAVAEEYDGSSWTNGGTMIKAVLFTGGIGTQTAALSAGGGTQSPSSGFVSTCQGYDGTSWSSRASLANPNYASGSGGTSTDGFIAGGGTSPYVATTEEFTGETTAGNVTDFTTS